MAQTKTKTNQSEYDSVYFLKILVYLIGGSVWAVIGGHRDVPLGLIVGLIVVQNERLQIDRKVEYAVLLIGGLLGLVGIGISIGL